MLKVSFKAPVIAFVGAIVMSGSAVQAKESIWDTTKEEGLERHEMTLNYIEENGIKAALKAIRNGKEPFAATYPAIAIQRTNDEGRHFVEAHTTYPSLQGVDFTDQEDLEGRKFIQNFFQKVQNGGGVATTTNAPPPEGERHVSQCYSSWAPGYKGEYWVVACYHHPDH